MNDDIWRKSFKKLLYLFNIPVEYLLFNDDENSLSFYYDCKKQDEIIRVINKVKSLGEYKITILYDKLPKNYQQELLELGVELKSVRGHWTTKEGQEE